MKTKTYVVPVSFIFEGEFRIRATSKEEAQNFAKTSCGATANVHHNMDDSAVNWDFPVHPEKKVKAAKVMKAVR